MVRGRGGSQTPSKVVELLQKVISVKGQSMVEKETGLSHSMISRYKRGIGEPSQATLEKLADYLKVSPAYLRGDEKNVIRVTSGEEVFSVLLDGSTEIKLNQEQIRELASAAIFAVAGIDKQEDRINRLQKIVLGILFVAAHPERTSKSLQGTSAERIKSLWDELPVNRIKKLLKECEDCIQDKD